MKKSLSNWKGVPTATVKTLKPALQQTTNAALVVGKKTRTDLVPALGQAWTAAEPFVRRAGTAVVGLMADGAAFAIDAMEDFRDAIKRKRAKRKKLLGLPFSHPARKQRRSRYDRAAEISEKITDGAEIAGAVALNTSKVATRWLGKAGKALGAAAWPPWRGTTPRRKGWRRSSTKLWMTRSGRGRGGAGREEEEAVGTICAGVEVAAAARPLPLAAAAAAGGRRRRGGARARARARGSRRGRRPGRGRGRGRRGGGRRRRGGRRRGGGRGDLLLRRGGGVLRPRDAVPRADTGPQGDHPAHDGAAGARAAAGRADAGRAGE